MMISILSRLLCLLVVGASAVLPMQTQAAVYPPLPAENTITLDLFLLAPTLVFQGVSLRAGGNARYDPATTTLNLPVSSVDPGMDGYPFYQSEGSSLLFVSDGSVGLEFRNFILSSKDSSIFGEISVRGSPFERTSIFDYQNFGYGGFISLSDPAGTAIGEGFGYGIAAQSIVGTVSLTPIPGTLALAASGIAFLTALGARQRLARRRPDASGVAGSSN